MDRQREGHIIKLYIFYLGKCENDMLKTTLATCFFLLSNTNTDSNTRYIYSLALSLSFAVCVWFSMPNANAIHSVF